MKAYSFENWLISEETKPLLFFVQSMEEMLFPYGHDSYKVPTLNFHFLCIEILDCINKIETEVIDKGNMRPLFDELRAMFLSDYVAKKLYGVDFNSLFYLKNEKGEYSRDCGSLNKDPGAETSLKVIQKTLLFLVEDMSINDKYFETLKREIEVILQKPSFDNRDAEILLGLSKILLTELINRGYSQEYIYSKIKERYYSSINITNIANEISYFWSLFTFENHKYNVILPVKRADIKKLLEHVAEVSVLENKNRFFANSCNWIVEMEIESLDPENAYMEMRELVSLFVSLKQYHSHISKAFYANRAIVKDIENEKQYNISKEIDLLSRGCTRSEQQIYERIGKMIQNFPVIGRKMFSAINLHASAMESHNVSNQLLNLWTIVEVLIEVDKRYSYSKITQTSNILTTVLNANYIKALMEQLVSDLNHCCMDFSGRIQLVTKGNSDIEKMIALLIFPEFEQDKENLINAIQNYPLLIYRIEKWAELFTSRIKLKEFLSIHQKRLEWQIMRIYRNRNMIVHDGTHFPYIDLIVQNLHFYIDTLIDTINYYVSEGYESLEAIYCLLSNKEFQYHMLLEKKDNSKAPLAITDDFIQVVLGNSYME